MKREIIKTADGSTTIHIPEWNEQYHSKHGAIQEARHVFIKMGLLHLLNSNPSNLDILEIGFGTGLNALVTWEEGLNHELNINYVGVEAYPVDKEEVLQLNFVDEINKPLAQEFFNDIHLANWEEKTEITSKFHLTKQEKFFQDINDVEQYDLIYFDAFGARVQPDLWEENIFRIMYDALRIDGVLVTYAAKGSVRRAMQTVGFEVERLPGPPGKREMLRATKIK